MICNIRSFLAYKSLKIMVFLLLPFTLSSGHYLFAALPTINMVEEQANLLSDNDAVDAGSIDKLQQIKKSLQEIASLQQKNAQLQLLLEQAPQQKMALHEKLQQAADAQPEMPPQSALPDDIEQNVATEKARNEARKTQLTAFNKQQQSLLEDQETLPNAIAEQEKILAQQRRAVQNISKIEADQISQWFAQTMLTMQEEKLKWLTLQQETLVQRRELAKLNAQIVSSQLTLASKQIELLQLRLLEVSTQSSLKVIEQAKQLSRALTDAPDAIQQWNVKNEALAIDLDALNRQLLLTRQARQDLEAQRQRVMQNLMQIKGNIKWLKSSPVFSEALTAQLQLLPDLSDKSDLAKSITAAHLKHFQLSSELLKLSDIPALIDQIADTSGLNTLQKKVLSGIFNFRYEMLSNALEKTDQFIAEITRLDALQDQFSIEMQEERDFLREKQLFIRDRTALWEISLWQLSHWFGTSSLSERIQYFLHLSADHGVELLLLGLFFLLVFTLILQLQKVEKRYLSAFAKVVGKVRQDSFSHTILLLLLAIGDGTLLASCLWGVDAWLALRFSDFYSDELGHLFVAVCIVILLWESLGRMALPDGLLAQHFAFPKESVRWLKSLLSRQRWILYSFLLGMLLSEMIADEMESPLLRIIFIALMLWLIGLIILLLKPHRLSALLPHFVQSANALQLLRVILILPLIATAILAAWGYFYASWLAFFYYATVLLCIGCSLLIQQLGVRWLKIEQRKISLQRALKKREEQLQRDKMPLSMANEVDESVIPVEDISEQSLMLLNLVVTIFLFTMLSTLLSDSLLALQWMNEVTIWEVVTLTESGNIVEAISLKAALSALIILGLSLFLVKNLPGVLELLLLHRLNISKGAAYATTTLLRYLLVLIGTLIAISTLGFNWSRLQWLVAALSVGLGFGLQEIFANFVSGIILLFERPVRVGDTITIQDLSGVVTRINTRATTILDWDKKEIVVPNKSLITEQLVNWSLSDATTRVIISVGVAYGSDVQLVKKLLLQAASECDEICQEPAPQALFLLFGESSLDFELRLFLPQVERRVIMVDKLNTSIDQLFRKHQIEIPFPQRDIHLRSLPDSE